PGEFLTSSDTGFSAVDDRARRLRTEALKLLRKGSSPWEKIGKERAFKAGHKGSTFPWANTASAVHEHTGRCWIASEVAIIGAASPFKLAYTKRAEATAFGSTGHPCELLAQSRANAGKVNWWREQLGTVHSDLDRAEWALALWCVATGPVVSDLLPELTEVLAQLPTPQRRTVLRAAEQIARFGWLGKRPVTGDTIDAELAALNQLRVQTGKAGQGERPASPRDVPEQPSLRSVARAEKWLKVDATPVYR
ncbi:MAG: large ATP-binding protein, partial [Dietzia sp.]|nr:large ATP-binding protein [Dietzia sp.]